MDQGKIGRFIAACRKEKKLTQMQLAEKLSVSDRAVSKWETGRSLPDASLMPELCSVLGITLNDLFSGEVVSLENYRKELEKNLLEAVRQKEEGDKRLLMLEWVVGALSVLILLIPALLAKLLPLAEWQRVLVAFSGFPPALIGIFFALKIEQVAGYYECRHCGHRYVPTWKAINLAPHMGRTRRMRCPACQQKSWQKKVISKDGKK